MMYGVRLSTHADVEDNEEIVQDGEDVSMKTLNVAGLGLLFFVMTNGKRWSRYVLRELESWLTMYARS